MHDAAGLIVVACLFIGLWMYLSQERPEEVADENVNVYQYLGRYYSELSGKRCEFEHFNCEGETGWDCYMNHDDGTFTVGIGDTPWQAFEGAKASSDYRFGQVTI